MATFHAKVYKKSELYYTFAYIFKSNALTVMIPKTIHYTWFSGDPFPDDIKACIASWHRFLPDYSFRLWDMDAIKDIDSIFLKEAIACKKWAYAADYVRLYAVYHEGGIYLDTDVMLFKNFDAFLSDTAFIGKENSIHFTGRQSSQYLTSHCFGGERHHPFLKKCLDYYTDRHFMTSQDETLPPPLRFNYVIMPYIQAEIARTEGYDWKPLTQTVQRCENGLVIYPTMYFDPPYKTGLSVCRHLALGSWRDEKSKEPAYNLRHKIEWRIVERVKKWLAKFNYVVMKIE